MIAVVIAIGRPVKMYLDEHQKVQSLEQIKRENEQIKKERDELKKQVSTPIRERVAEEIRHVFGKRAQEAIQIAQCESGLNPDHTHYNNNHTSDYSVFQINSISTKI